jgi:spore coat protein U-like protein
MINTGFLRLAGGIALAATAASAASAGKTGSTLIGGTLAGKCKVTVMCGSDACSSIDAQYNRSGGNGNNTITGNVVWQCNLTNQPVVLTFTSANNGVLKNGANQLTYKAAFTGVNLATFTGQTLNPSRTSAGASGSANQQFSGTLTLTVDPNQNPQPGNYFDTVTVTISPNGL